MFHGNSLNVAILGPTFKAAIPEDQLSTIANYNSISDLLTYCFRDYPRNPRKKKPGASLFQNFRTVHHLNNQQFTDPQNRLMIGIFPSTLEVYRLQGKNQAAKTGWFPPRTLDLHFHTISGGSDRFPNSFFGDKSASMKNC